jgi:hypothetical protein
MTVAEQEQELRAEYETLNSLFRQSKGVADIPPDARVRMGQLYEELEMHDLRVCSACTEIRTSDQMIVDTCRSCASPELLARDAELAAEQAARELK